MLSISAKTGRILGLAVLLALGAGSGVVVGKASASQAPVASTQAIEVTPAPVDDADLVTTLTVQEPPGATAATRPANSAPGAGSPARAATRPSSASSANIQLTVSVPGAAPAAAADAIQCDRLDDAKIHWLLNLVAKTKAANPGSEQAAAQVDQQLRGALGKNMCAAEAQRYVGAMCADPAVYAFMQKMVQQLPFFVRPMVGDPCTQDLVAVANKYMR